MVKIRYFLRFIKSQKSGPNYGFIGKSAISMGLATPPLNNNQLNRPRSDRDLTALNSSITSATVTSTVVATTQTETQTASSITSDPLDSIRIKALESEITKLKSDKSQVIEVLKLLQEKYKFSDDYLNVVL